MQQSEVEEKVKKHRKIIVNLYDNQMENWHKQQIPRIFCGDFSKNKAAKTSKAIKIKKLFLPAKSKRKVSADSSVKPAAQKRERKHTAQSKKKSFVDYNKTYRSIPDND